LPVTSFDIPRDLLAFLDELVSSGVARNRREIVIRALRNFVKLQMHKWKGSLMVIHGVRQGLVSSGSVKELLAGRSEKEMYEAGKRMGRTLKDSALVERRLDVTRSENFKAASQILEDQGWGVFTMNDSRMVIVDSFLPPAVIHGYLEGALSVNLKRVETAEDVIVLESMSVLARRKAHRVVA